MDANLTEAAFVDFGDDLLYPFARVGLSRIESDSADELRADVRRYVPRVPGVYGMLDVLGRLIYVGKSKCLRNRLLSYFLPNNEEDKAGRIVQSTCAIVWEYQPSDFAALLREQSLIRRFQPRYNVQGIPRRQQPIYVCLGRGPAEQFYTARQQDPKALFAVGPLFGAMRANRAVEVLNRLFLLRDCSSKQPCSFTEQLQLFDIARRPGCLRLEIESCLGPCIAACSRSVYARQVALGKAFLEGSNDEPVAEVEQAMLRAARGRHFEQAIVLREDLKAITWLSRRAGDMAQARQRYTFVYPVMSQASAQQPLGHASREVWYLIRRGLIEGAVAAPTTAGERRQVESLLKKWLANDRCLGAEYTPRPETLALVASWFRNNRSELKRTFLPEGKRHAVKEIVGRTAL
ncbi:MAG: GIY-YIG nuclease family protein [Pirellulaceae bacterium]|jgi:excinuclease ABC subunit C